MTFKYSICYPDKADIEYRNDPMSGEEVLEIAKTYPWIEQLNLLNSLNEERIHYNPSLDFTCIENGKSFSLTANYSDNKKLEFSLWYNRPKRLKVLFGLLGEKEKMTVDDVWSIPFEKSLEHLDHFVNGNYASVEKLY